MRKVMFPLYLEPEQLDELQKKSAETGRPMAAIAREWLDRGRGRKEDTKK